MKPLQKNVSSKQQLATEPLNAGEKKSCQSLILTAGLVYL